MTDLDGKTPRDPAVAVVGVGAMFPGSKNAQGFWRDIVCGTDLITDVPATHWLPEDYFDADPQAPDKTYARRGAFLDAVDFDTLKFGMPPSNLQATDTSQLLSLIVAQHVYDDATTTNGGAIDSERVSVIIGVTSAQELYGKMVSRMQRPVWVKAMREEGLPEDEVQRISDRIAGHYAPWQESTFPGLLGNVVAGRIANRLDLGGTNCVTDAACASSFSAVSMAVNELALRQSDMVIVGGVDTMNDILMYMCFSKTPALSPSGDCRPFAEAADGTMLGEGIGMVALRRLEDAERDGNRIYAVVRGVGTSSDGRSTSVYAPVAAGQAKALRRAYERAGYSPDTVELVEAHGTGTGAGDKAEVEGLKTVFGEAGEARAYCALGSVKSQIGHAKAASGAAGLFKAVMALHHRVLPPTIKVDRPNPALGLEGSAFYLNTESRPWVRSSDHPRRVGVSSFGFGGSNFHLTLEEYRGRAARAPRLRTADHELVIIGGTTSAEVLSSIDKHAARCGDGILSSLAHDTAHSDRSAQRNLLSIVARDDDDLRAKLDRAAAMIKKDPDGRFSIASGIHYGVRGDGGDVAFLFPGQGSQYLGMGRGLALHFDAAIEVWDRAADFDFGPAEPPLHEVVFPRPVFSAEDRDHQLTRLTRTEWAQPGIGCVSLSMLSLLSDLGIKPTMVGGHSFGDVTALHVAGVLSDVDLLRVARKRGEVMAEAARTPGSMIAVPRPVGEVRELVDRLGLDLVVANHNAPMQVVLSGSTQAVVDAEAKLEAEGVNATRLRVATAFHSPIVAQSVGPFYDFLKEIDFQRPQLPAFANSTARPYPEDAEALRQCLADQIANPVRFVEQIEAMYEAGIRTFVEVGPSSVLTNLVTQILEGRDHQAINLDRKNESGLKTFLAGLARLEIAGHDLDLSVLWQGYAEPEGPDVESAQSAVTLIGANYGNLYPPLGGAGALPDPNPKVAGAPSRQQTVEYNGAAARDTGQLDPSPQQDWLDAFAESQRQTASAHASFQKAMGEAHHAFLKSAEASLTSLAAALGGEPPNTADWPTPDLPDFEVAAPQMPTVADPSSPTETPTSAQEPTVAELVQEDLPPAGARTGEGVDVARILMKVVADKTGYPEEMLNLDMDLEGDLGIDSIKRVEILSAMVEEAPELPEVEASEMVGLRTLTQIVDYLGVDQGSVVASPEMADVAGILMKVVAGKTGYPEEMLNLDMDLEGDLGIDSIKRVEILSAMVEEAPELPEVEASEMVGLRTLAAIVDHLTVAQGSGEAPNNQDVDIAALLVEVVAEKTGYPDDMLSLDMDLEGDLGIDSIKRVEILSAMVERVPELPEVEASEMVNLRSLADVVAYLQRGFADRREIEARDERTEGPERGGIGRLGRYVLDVVEAPALGMAQPGLFEGGLIAITDDGSGVAAELADLLGQRGIRTRIGDAAVSAADGLVFLGGLRALSMPEEADEINREAFRLARSIAGRARVLITVQDTGGRFGVGTIGEGRAVLGGLAGLAKTAAQEWPSASVKAIDLERGNRRPQEIALALANELLSGGPELEVGLACDGTRVTLHSRQSSVTPGRLPFDASSVVVVSGGARGVTARTMIALARSSRPRLLLLGRSRLDDESDAVASCVTTTDLRKAILEDQGTSISPAEVEHRLRSIKAAREVQETLNSLAAVGAEVRYAAVDITDADAVEESIATVRTAWGPITGVIHGAGVIADRLIADKDDDDFDRVFNVKVAGLNNLLAATANDPLKVICLFSSIASRTGNPGQCDYAMANEVLNKVAQAERQRRNGACLVKSLCWGPWKGGMVTDEIAARFEARGVPLLPLETGEQMLIDELAGAAPDEVEVVLGAEPAAVPSDGGPGDFKMDMVVNRQSHPYLQAHALNGTPVVPVVLAVEWFARVARAMRPDLQMACLHDLKVLKGVRLEGFNDGGDRLVLRGSQRSTTDGVSLEMTVESSEGRPHYTATLELVARRGLPTSTMPSLDLARWDERAVYGGVLFHGPEFQVIRQVNGISDEGVSATLKGIREKAWSAETWRTDAASFDGGLQLALLWSERVLGGASLPTRIDEVRTWTDDLPNGPVQCVLRGREAANGRTVSDVVFQSENGQLVAELVGVETHTVPSGS